MAHSTTYFPRFITRNGRRKEWFTGSYIGNLKCAADSTRQHRHHFTLPDGSPCPEGTVILRHHCNINYYR